ncbi:MAG: hypothetical protein EZS28_001468 [Streblomastix strix]|uniref:Uncharacterized protein n=1 Tax=Streblomastix strix TaxID=222440 RepID=A0A5J4X746_9EUKA|nr:MAG: hypothetical protein EZS28_001468 [Streblomastix strix]
MDSSCGIQRVGRNSRSSLTALLNQLMTFEEEFVEFAEDIGLVDSLYLVSYHWNKEAQLPAVLILVNFANSMLGC